MKEAPGTCGLSTLRLEYLLSSTQYLKRCNIIARENRQLGCRRMQWYGPSRHGAFGIVHACNIQGKNEGRKRRKRGCWERMEWTARDYCERRADSEIDKSLPHVSKSFVHGLCKCQGYKTRISVCISIESFSSEKKPCEGLFLLS